MKVLTINTEKFNLPGSWNELTAEQLRRIAGLSLQRITPSDFRLKCLLTITGLRLVRRKEIMVDGIPHYYIRTPGKNVYLFDLEELADVLERLDFLFEAEGENVAISSRLFKNIIGEIKAGKEIWYGPADGLANITTGEYIRTETCLVQYYKTKAPKHLWKLIAALWRPEADKPSSTDKRCVYDDGLVEERAWIVGKSVPEDVQQSIFLFYVGCRKAIAAKFKNASDQEGSGQKDEDVFMQFMRLVSGLANNDVTKHEAVRQAYLMETMITIDEMARQARELDEKIKSNKTK